MLSVYLVSTVGLPSLLNLIWFAGFNSNFITLHVGNGKYPDLFGNPIDTSNFFSILVPQYLPFLLYTISTISGSSNASVKSLVTEYG